MTSTRRLAMAVLCSTSLAAALVAATPAVASAPASHRAACGASASDYNGTFAGEFDNNPAATLSTTFAAPRSVTTTWSLPGWDGAGKGEYELSATGPEWTNSDTISGTLTGVSNEVYRSVAVSCANGDGTVTSIAGVVDSGKAQVPFTINRQ